MIRKRRIPSGVDTPALTSMLAPLCDFDEPTFTLMSPACRFLADPVTTAIVPELPRDVTPEEISIDPEVLFESELLNVMVPDERSLLLPVEIPSEPPRPS